MPFGITDQDPNRRAAQDAEQQRYWDAVRLDAVRTSNLAVAARWQDWARQRELGTTFAGQGALQQQRYGNEQGLLNQELGFRGQEDNQRYDFARQQLGAQTGMEKYKLDSENRLRTQNLDFEKQKADQAQYDRMVLEDQQLSEKVKSGDLIITPELQQAISGIQREMSRVAISADYTESGKQQTLKELHAKMHQCLQAAVPAQGFQKTTPEDLVKKTLGPRYDQYKNLPWVPDGKGSVQLPRGWKPPTGKEQTPGMDQSHRQKWFDSATKANLARSKAITDAMTTQPGMTPEQIEERFGKPYDPMKAPDEWSSQPQQPPPDRSGGQMQQAPPSAPQVGYHVANSPMEAGVHAYNALPGQGQVTHVHQVPPEAWDAVNRAVQNIQQPAGAAPPASSSPSPPGTAPAQPPAPPPPGHSADYDMAIYVLNELRAGRKKIDDPDVMQAEAIVRANHPH